MSIVQAYLINLSTFRKATSDVGKLARSANKEDESGSHSLHPPLQALSVDILEFLQMT